MPFFRGCVCFDFCGGCCCGYSVVSVLHSGILVFLFLFMSRHIKGQKNAIYLFVLINSFCVCMRVSFDLVLECSRV